MDAIQQPMGAKRTPIAAATALYSAHLRARHCAIFGCKIGELRVADYSTAPIVGENCRHLSNRRPSQL